MLRFVTVFAAAVAFASSAPSPAINVFKTDISPEEAQKYLNSPPFTDPQLSGRNAVLPLVRWNDPRFRTAEAGPTLGHYWKNGHEIENTEDYVEEVYDASQFHGQDGLGAYAYGYKTPESAKVENRARSGDLTGSYAYKSGNDLIKVRYWADSEGFHQEDNIPKVVLEPIQEAEDVRLARLAHEKAWQEAAAASAQNPDPQGAYNSNYDQHYISAASEPQGVVASAPAQAREGKAYGQNQNYQQSGQYGGSDKNGQNSFGAQPGQYGPQSGQFGQQQAGQYGQQQAGQYGQQSGSKPGQYGQQSGSKPGQYEDPEPTGPPKGFFYSFDYPVSIIVPKNEAQGGPAQAGYPVDQDTVSLNAQRG